MATRGVAPASAREWLLCRMRLPDWQRRSIRVPRVRRGVSLGWAGTTDVARTCHRRRRALAASPVQVGGGRGNARPSGRDVFHPLRSHEAFDAVVVCLTNSAYRAAGDFPLRTRFFALSRVPSRAVIPHGMYRSRVWPCITSTGPHARTLECKPGAILSMSAMAGVRP